MDIASLEALLLVQEQDTALDRLRHRRASLPERAQLETRAGELQARSLDADRVREERDHVLAQERRMDDQARAIGEHADDVDRRLYSGTVSSPRELQAMQADVEMLRRQRSDLEDRELEIMEQRETLEAQLGALEAEIGTARADVERLQTSIVTAEREIDDEIAEESRLRAEHAAAVPEQLLADYERRRAQNRGAGAARLVATTCQACHLSIPSTEAERIRRAGGTVVAYCDNCGAILVP
jgi:uncharacterized protein